MGKYLRVYLVFGKISILLWQKCYAFGQIVIAVKGQIFFLKKAIWSHWWVHTFNQNLQKEVIFRRKNKIYALQNPGMRHSCRQSSNDVDCTLCFAPSRRRISPKKYFGKIDKLGLNDNSFLWLFRPVFLCSKFENDFASQIMIVVTGLTAIAIVSSYLCIHIDSLWSLYLDSQDGNAIYWEKYCCVKILLYETSEFSFIMEITEV